MQKQESVMKNQLTNGDNSMSDPITVIKPENAVTKIPFNERYTLTLNEASQYFHIGYTRLRLLAECNIGVFAIRCGNRYLIVLPKFEEYLINTQMI